MKKILNWIKNYWYYYKIRVLVAVMVLALVVFGIYEFASRENYDYTVYLCVSENASSEFIGAVKAAVSQYGEDVDQSGEVKVQLIDLSYDFTSSDDENSLAKTALLGGELQTGGHYIFFYDIDYYEEYLMGLFESNDALTKNDNTAYELKDTDLESLMKAGLSSVNFDPDSLPELYMSLRCAPEDTKSDNYTTYKNDKQLFLNIIEDKPTVAEQTK